MSDLATFTKEIQQAIEKAPKLLNKVVRKVALDGHKNIVAGTPLDTGRAKANWQIDINQTNNAVEELHTTGMSKEVAEMLAGQHRDKLGKFQVGDVIHVYNNLEYILPLEFDGTSQQAPAGWVRSEAIKMENVLDEGLKAINKL